MEVLEALMTKSKMDVAREFGIGYSTVKKIKKNEEEIIKKAAESGNLLRKRCRRSPNEEVGNALITWYYQIKERNMPVNGPIMLDKAKELAIAFGFEDFKPSHGWLERLKARNNIRFKPSPNRILSEEDEWTKVTLPVVTEGYDANDIFNADETALFYKAAPAILTGNHPQSAATPQDRLTVLFLCNSTGTEKKVFAVGNISNPACFEKEGTPLPYYSSENALMTDWIWCDILQKLDQSLGKRKIILFTDKEACHSVKMTLRNIKIAFTPSSLPSETQPLNQGIIRMVKIYYRSRLVKTLMSALNEGILAADFTNTIDILRALRILDSAWVSVPPAVIVNSFQKAGFQDNDLYCLGDIVDNSNEVSELEELLQEDFETYIECDKDVNCFGVTSTNSKSFNQIPSKPENIDMDEDDDKQLPHVTYKEALKALSTVRRYLDENFTEYDAYYEVEEMIRLSAYASASEEDIMD